MAGPAASDVPDRYDVVFSLNDGTTYGFLYADSVESNLPFRTHKALYSYSPTFLERQNLSNTYGDNFQDFFLTASQADFSEGEGQKFFRVNDQDSVRKYWNGSNVAPTKTPGNVTLTTLISTITQANVTSISPVGGLGTQVDPTTPFGWVMADSTNLFGVTLAGVVVTVGAHSSGTISDICMDASSCYLAGSTHLGKITNTVFSTFSAQVVNKLAYLNGILFAWQASTDSLLSFDTAGNPTTQFTWKGADGQVATSTSEVKALVPYGGSLYILRRGPNVGELWKYDGSGVSKLADFMPDFYVSQMCVSQGIVYVSGYLRFQNATRYYPAIYYYANGSIGKLWDSQVNNTFAATEADVGLAPYQDGVVFCDISTNNILRYSLSIGGAHTIATIANPGVRLATANITSGFMAFAGSSVANKYLFGISASYNSSGFIQTSQYDFDNTLSKVFRSIKVDADIPANTSVDIAYQLDGAGGTYTNLQTGAASGTEYLLPANTTGHSISVQITLNSATGSATPTLKHVYVRAAPTLQQFRKREFLFDLSGGSRDELGKSSRRTRDLMAYPKDPITACNDLVKIATQTIPFTVYDRFTTGGMTVIADLQQNQAGYDGFAIYEVRPNVFIGRINLREV